MKKSVFYITACIVLLTVFSHTADAQQYKLRQSSSIMGMNTGSTIYVKGMRKRTESEAMMGMPRPPVTIEQCDLQRTIKINDKKKLYFIIPFAKDAEEVIDEDAKPATKPKPAVPDKNVAKKGGTITMWYTITDTGERKKMNGFIARHIWTYQKIKPSPDACTMKDSIIIKTDGWYIDLPQFNCPERYSASTPNMNPEQRKPDCVDKFVTRRKGKGKLGFPLTETRTIIMGGANPQMSEFETKLETLEFITTKLDSMLFEIPPGYTLAASEEDLQDKMDMGDMMNQFKNMNKNGGQPANGNEPKKAGVIRIGVLVPAGDAQLNAADLQQYLAADLNSGKTEGVPVADAEEAKRMNCDYTLSTEFTRLKSASKVGGLLKAIKNADPNAASSFNIDANMTLVSVKDGSVKLQPTISGKFEGKADDAARKALDDGSRQILKGL